MVAEEFVEAVLDVVDRIPSGRVTTYGAIAAHLGRGGPRQVGRVMATQGGAVTWWRVVRADGTLPEALREEARARHLSEGTPLKPDGRLDLSRAFVDPDELSGGSAGIRP